MQDSDFDLAFYSTKNEEEKLEQEKSFEYIYILYAIENILYIYIKHSFINIYILYKYIKVDTYKILSIPLAF